MDDATIYHAERLDGGRRTGIWLDKQLAFENYVRSEDEHDPALAWHMEMRWPLKKTMQTQQDVARWLKDRYPIVERIFKDVSSQLTVGIDVDPWPWTTEIDGPEGPIKLQICAMRKFAGQNISKSIDEFVRGDWSNFLSETVSERAA